MDARPPLTFLRIIGSILLGFLANIGISLVFIALIFPIIAITTGTNPVQVGGTAVIPICQAPIWLIVGINLFAKRGFSIGLRKGLGGFSLMVVGNVTALACIAGFAAILILTVPFEDTYMVSQLLTLFWLGPQVLIAVIVTLFKKNWGAMTGWILGYFWFAIFVATLGAAVWAF